MRLTALFGLAAVAGLVLLSGCRGVSPEKLIDQGIHDFQMRDLDAAQAKIGQALRSRPHDPDALFYMGRIHHARGFPEQAMYYYQCCLDAAPGYPAVKKYLAQAQKEAGPMGSRLRFIPDAIQK